MARFEFMHYEVMDLPEIILMQNSQGALLYPIDLAVIE